MIQVVDEFQTSQSWLTLHINGKQLPFPLTEEGFCTYTTNIADWKIPQVPGRAPFLNRESILAKLISHVYQNYAELTRTPFYALQTACWGSGKTRLLVEWVYQALNNPQIIQDFLRNITTNPNDSLVKRKQFLNALYEAACTESIILVHGISSVLSTGIEEIIRRFIEWRFEGATVQFEGQNIYITDNFELTEVDDNNSLLVNYIKLFNLLVDSFKRKPKDYPFPEVGVGDRKLLLFGLDGSEEFSEKQEDAKKEDLIFNLFNAAGSHDKQLLKDANTSCFWFAVGTHIPGEILVSEPQFDLIDGGMDNLLNVRSLNTLSEHYFKKSLPGVSNAKYPFLHPASAKAFVRNFMHTCGLPRNIEYLIQDSYKRIMEAERLLTNPKCSRDDLLCAKEILDGIDEPLGQRMASSHKEPYLSSVPNSAIERLDIEAAFCMEFLDVSIEGLEYSPSELEDCGDLFTWEQGKFPLKLMTIFLAHF